MRKIGTIATLCLFVLGTMASPALADSPKFHSANASKNGLDLNVTFQLTGLGNTGGDVDISVSASATATYQCFNNGGKHPKAGNKTTVTAPVSNGGSFPISNGQASGTITVSLPGPGSFSCPSGQDLTLISGTFSNITITGAGVTVSTKPNSISVP
jgi:hypothetical protein